MTIIDTILLCFAIYLSFYLLYTWIIISSHFFLKERQPRVAGIPNTRFGVIIPAHNEELLLDRLLKSARDQDYPNKLFRAIVIADNCSDQTSKVALENGALVFERVDLRNRGKGFAVRFALEKLDLDEYDALLIVDADSVLARECLSALDHALNKGDEVVQCYNGVLNPDESWFTRLLDVSRTISNEIIHPGKRQLGLSSYLMGNGMCFSVDILARYGWDAFTVGEDWEYYAKLIRDGGTVGFSNEARVYHQESTSLRQATTQRMRWSSGRFAVAWQYGLGLLIRGIGEGNLVKMDAAFPLLLPNPSLGMNLTSMAFFCSLEIPFSGGNWIFPSWFAALAGFQLGIFVTGIYYTERRLKNFLSIFIAPLFLAWKMGIDLFSVVGFGRERWIRTERRM